MFTFEVGTLLTDCVLLTVIQLLTCSGVYSEDDVTLASLTVDNKVLTYQMYTNTSTWKDADSYCQSWRPGSRLAILDSEVKLSKIKKSNSSLWIGGLQNESDSYWLWSNGEPLEEPSGNGDCLAVDNNMTKAISCQTKSRYYVCSFSVSASSCPTEGEILYNSSTECIKLFNVPDSKSNITWIAAKSKCLNKNGSLASLTGINITLGANVAHVGGKRHYRWWWAYNTKYRIKAISFTVNETEPSGQCLLATDGGIMAKNCTEQHYVLCESMHIMMATSVKWKIFLIIGVMTAILVLLIVVITVLVRRLRRLHKKKERPHSSGQQTDAIYSEALAAYPDTYQTSSVAQTTDRQTEPRRQPMASPYAMARIESIIDRERRENVQDSPGTGSRESQQQGSETEERLSPRGNDGTELVTSREQGNPDIVRHQ